MAEFTQYLQRISPFQPFASVNTNMNTGMLKQLPVLNQNVLENFSFPDISADFLMAHQQAEFPASNDQNNRQSSFHPDILASAPTVHTVETNQNVFPEFKKRKAMEQSTSGTKSISPTTSTANTQGKNSTMRGKKGKNVEKGLDKTEEVVHVRAKRGQATDRHSIAERVRREKISNKLRCLQDLVPGCNQSMGMAVMLEEIINYVHSLQNQVEFLSMELAAASSYPCGLNMEAKPPIKLQGTNTTEAQVAQDTHKWLTMRYGDTTYFHPSWSI